MGLERRTFLQGALGIAGASLVPLRATATLSLGQATLTTVSDGFLTLPGDMVFGPMPEAALAPILERHGVDRATLTPACNLALLRDGARTILFDAGAGPDFMPSAGRLLDSLDALGLAPADITDVVFTHAHPDHIWGLLDDFDDLTFPNAAYRMGRTEWDYWWNPETVDTIGEARAAFAVGARRRMERIEDSVTLMDDGEVILPGLVALATPGHTPGHMSFEVRQGTTAALIVGDAIGNHHVAFARPDWESGSDQMPDLAVRTRRRLLERATAEDMHLVGFHFPAAGVGRAEAQAEGFRFLEGDG